MVVSVFSDVSVFWFVLWLLFVRILNILMNVVIIVDDSLVGLYVSMFCMKLVNLEL